MKVWIGLVFLFLFSSNVVYVNGAVVGIEDVPEFSKTVYRIQICASVDSEKANQVASEAASLGFHPVSVTPDPPFYKTRVGLATNYPDAMILKERIQGAFPGCFIQAESATTEVESTLETLMPNKQIFLTVDQKVVFPESDFVIDESGFEFARIPKTYSSDDMVTQTCVNLKNITSNLDKSDAMNGFYSFYLALAEERRTSKARHISCPMMLSIATGETSAPSGYSKLAALHYADMAHYTWCSTTRAYEAYKWLLTSDAIDQNEKAELKTQLAACLLEFLDSGAKGTPETVRFECSQLYRSMSSDLVRHRGTVELIYSETYFWDGSLEDVLEYSLDIAERYQGQIHIVAQALWNAGVCQYRLNRLDDSRKTFQQIVNLNLNPQDSFKARLNGCLDISARAKNYLNCIDGVNKVEVEPSERALSVKTNLLFTQIPGFGD